MWPTRSEWCPEQVSLLDRPSTLVPPARAEPALPRRKVTSVPGTPAGRRTAGLRTADRRTDRQPTGRAWFVARQLGLLLVAVTVYFGVRGLTVGSASTATANAHDLVALERSLGIFVEQQVQAFALDLPGVMTVANTIYIYGHWPVIALVLVWLAWRRPDAYPVYRNALLISGLVGMAIVALHPTAPPRLMDLGFLDTVTTQTNAYRVLQPPAFTNPYAAMPSFHVGWDLLVGIALVRESGNAWARAAGRTIPVLMVVSVVLTGNHYFLDAIAGDAIVLASLGLVIWWRGRAHGQRRTSNSSPAPINTVATVSASAARPPRPRTRTDEPAECR